MSNAAPALKPVTERKSVNKPKRPRPLWRRAVKIIAVAAAAYGIASLAVIGAYAVLFAIVPRERVSR